MEAILKINTIDKSFALRGQRKAGRNGQEGLKVIDRLSLEIPRGMISALIGGNGAGKTTLFNILSGLLRPDAGGITYVKGKENIFLDRLKPYEISRLGVGRMFQGTRIFSDLTIEQNLMLFMIDRSCEMPVKNIFKGSSVRSHLEWQKNKLYEKLEMILTGENWVYPILENKASSVSFAEQRLLSLIGMILGDHDLILLDEPTSGIELEYLPKIKEWIRLAKENGTTVFIIEHNMEFVSDIADNCHFMASGKVLYSGLPEDVLQHPDVRKSYLI